MYPLAVNTIDLSEDITAIFQCSWGPTSKPITSAPKFFYIALPSMLHQSTLMMAGHRKNVFLYGPRIQILRNKLESYSTPCNNNLVEKWNWSIFKMICLFYMKKESISSDPMEKQTITCHTHKQITELLRSSSKTSKLHCLTPELKAYTSWVLRQTSCVC